VVFFYLHFCYAVSDGCNPAGKGGVRLRAIKKRCFIFAAFTGFFILIGVMLLVFGESASEIRAQILLASIIIAGGIAAGFWIRELRKLKIARLIAENPILHIRTAAISDLSGEEAQPQEPENTEVFISYFGILLDAKIIKFNQDGIRLRAVEIGEDFISFTYGMEKQTRNIRLLRPAIDLAAMEKISERFRYETGITPTLLS
jgi:hypothetical protein